MDFSDALKGLKLGHKLARSGWNGKDMWIAMQEPDLHSMMQEPYVYMKNAQGRLIPWLCSQGDLFATDWEIVDDV